MPSQFQYRQRKAVEAWLIEQHAPVHVESIGRHFEIDSVEAVKEILSESVMVSYNKLTSTYNHVWTNAFEMLKDDAKGKIVKVKTWANDKNVPKAQKFEDYVLGRVHVFHVFKGGRVRIITPLNVASKAGLLAAIAQKELRGVDLNVAVCEYDTAVDDIRLLEKEGLVVVVADRVWVTKVLQMPHA